MRAVFGATFNLEGSLRDHMDVLVQIAYTFVQRKEEMDDVRIAARFACLLSLLGGCAITM